MADAYRTSGFTCPSCPSQIAASLREFQNRLVCDECDGMLIEAADFAASIHEIDGSTDALEFVDEKPSSSPAGCPRCTKPMASCALKLGKLKVVGTFLRCERDGLWFPREAMTAVFARVSRRVHGGYGGYSGGLGIGGRGGGGGGVSNMPSGHGGMSGAMSSIANAFGGGAPASSGLAISRWQDRRPRVHTLFVSAHRERRLGCPSCREAALDYQGDRWACATCAGSFVENVALAAMVTEMSQQPWEVPVVSGAPGDRSCPICEAKMIVEVLEAVTIDRCASHGVWFDDAELQAALQHASGIEPTGVGGWLKRLFHRHGTTE